MKATSLCLFLFFSFCGCNYDKSINDQAATQPNVVPSIELANLPQYSVILGIHNSKGDMSIGTGFFVRYNTHLFLIGNYHVFTSQNTMTKTTSDVQGDSLEFRYRKSFLNGESDTIHINLLSIRSKSKPHYFFEYPDLYIYDLTDRMPIGVNIPSIESFIVPNFNGQKADDILGVGYTKENMRQPLQQHFSLSDFPYDRFGFDYPNKGKTVELTNSYFVKGQSQSGMSGSPLYFIYKVDKGDSIVFAGVISSHFGTANTTLIVKPQEVIKMIERTK